MSPWGLQVSLAGKTGDCREGKGNLGSGNAGNTTGMADWLNFLPDSFG